jgi:hypothetical protein
MEIAGVAKLPVGNDAICMEVLPIAHFTYAA